MFFKFLKQRSTSVKKKGKDLFGTCRIYSYLVNPICFTIFLGKVFFFFVNKKMTYPKRFCNKQRGRALPLIKMIWDKDK